MTGAIQVIDAVPVLTLDGSMPSTPSVSLARSRARWRTVRLATQA